MELAAVQSRVEGRQTVSCEAGELQPGEEIVLALEHGRRTRNWIRLRLPVQPRFAECFRDLPQFLGISSLEGVVTRQQQPLFPIPNSDTLPGLMQCDLMESP